MSNPVEIFVAPSTAVAQDRFGVETPNLWNPWHVQGVGKRTGERGSASGFSTNNDHTQRQSGTHRGTKAIPGCKDVPARDSAGHGHHLAGLIHHHMLGTHVVRPVRAVILAAVHHVRCISEELHGVGRPRNGIVIFPNVGNDVYPRAGMFGLEPLPAQLRGYDVVGVIHDQHVHFCAVGKRGVNQVMVAFMRWVEFSCYNAASSG